MAHIATSKITGPASTLQCLLAGWGTGCQQCILPSQLLWQHRVTYQEARTSEDRMFCLDQLTDPCGACWSTVVFSLECRCLLNSVCEHGIKLVSFVLSCTDARTLIAPADFLFSHVVCVPCIFVPRVSTSLAGAWMFVQVRLSMWWLGQHFMWCSHLWGCLCSFRVSCVCVYVLIRPRS